MWARSFHLGLFALSDPGAGTAHPPGDALEVLERFAHEVPGCPGPVEQIRCTLRAIREGLGADVAFWYPGDGPKPFELSAVRGVDPEWCRALAGRLLAETPGVEGRLLRADLPLAAGARSAVMVRLSKTRGTWLVALSFPTGRAFHAGDVRFLGVVRQVLANVGRRDQLYGRMSDTLHWLVRCLTAAIEARLPHAQGHCERVAQTSVLVGKQLGLSRPVLSDLYFAGLLHDIGLTGVPEWVIQKRGRLTEEEFAQVRQAPVIGDGILAGIRQLAHLRPVVRGLRERYDGGGYPDGLAGELIPLLARILAAADAFDALSSPRPHRLALSLAEVERVLVDGAGQQWDPVVVKHLLACRAAIEPLRQAGAAAVLSSGIRSAVEVWNVDTSRPNGAVAAGAPVPGENRH